MPSELELVFVNEQKTQVDIHAIEEQLTRTLSRLRKEATDQNPLQQSVGVGRLITEIVFVGDKKIKALNAQFRGVDTPTDVLSFTRNGEDPNYPASIVISIETATRQSVVAGWSLSQEIVSLANHGFLHVLGFSHA